MAIMRFSANAYLLLYVPLFHNAMCWGTCFQTCPQHYIATLKIRTMKQFDEKGLLLHWASFASMHKPQRTELIIMELKG